MQIKFLVHCVFTLCHLLTIYNILEMFYKILIKRRKINRIIHPTLSYMQVQKALLSCGRTFYININIYYSLFYYSYHSTISKHASREVHLLDTKRNT